MHKIRKIVFIILILLYTVQLVKAETHTVNPTDQNGINEALEKGGTVYLTSGIYTIDGPIYINSNTVLTGDPDAIIRVSSSSSQWFKGSTGIISCKGPLQNVEIYGFQIDGNIGNLPKSYADSREDTDHDCEKLILIGGWSNEFSNNIKIHHMRLYDAFSDGVYIRYSEGVEVSDNIISNCQHEGVYLSVVWEGVIRNNKVAAITSDGARLDNCKDCLVEENLFVAFQGESYGAYKGGANGLQVGDAKSSHGYNAAKPQFKTENIEIRNNTFADPGLKAIWLHPGTKNTYIHDNEFVDAAGLETMGVPIEEITIDNPPTVEMSEDIFSSIFDILDQEFTDTGITEQKADDINFQVQTTEAGKLMGGIEIIGFNNTIKIENKTYIPDENSVLVKYAVFSNPAFTILGPKIDQDVNIKIENGTTTATLTAKMKYYKTKTNKITGERKKASKKAKATFNDSKPSPEILIRPAEKKGYINEYRNKFNPNARVYVDPAGLQKIEYKYAGDTANHIFLIGERKTDSKGIEYTVYTRADRWDGNITNLGDELVIYGNFDPKKLTVTCFTPYESFKITDFEHTIHRIEKDTWENQRIEFILKTLLLLFCGYRLVRIIIP